ncbi:MAG: SDR family NAD(P)-dependent oxidoreductase, partial [Desulfobacterales bacterium]
MTDPPVIIVSGASRGLGAATARWLASSGAAITLISRSADGLEIVAKEVQRLGGAPLAIRADVSDAGSCRTAVLKTANPKNTCLVAEITCPIAFVIIGCSPLGVVALPDHERSI